MRRRLILLVLLLTLLTGAAGIVWTAAGLPPVRFLFRYGLSPYCSPTGRTVEVEGLTFVEISPGIFRMGSHYLCDRGNLLGRLGGALRLSWGRTPRHGDPMRGSECPVHRVEFRDAFWIARTEVTNEHYQRIGEVHHEHDFVNASFRVGTRRSNAWGLHDLHGNVSELCEDLYHQSYEGAPANGSAWTEGTTGHEPVLRDRVCRGGSTGVPAEGCRSACRYETNPGSPYADIGFRPAFSIRTDAERAALQRYIEKIGQAE